jgi:parallel beta-helix repeat protein
LVPQQYATIQAAIDDCNDGDVVVIAPGTYTGDGNRDIRFLGKAITVRSTDPNDPNIIAATIIDCDGTEAEPHRAFSFHNREDPNAVLTGLSIANGWESKGGAIYCDEHCSPTITHCWITNNSANRGGGIHCRGPKGSPVIRNCRVSHNSASGPSDLFTFGGGIACKDNASPLITGCLITDNSASTGGGIYFSSLDAHLTHCTVVGNSSPEGEGIYCSGWSQPGHGLIISNSIVWGNSGADGPDIAGSAPIVSYSNVEGGYPGTSNIDADPLFVYPDAGDYHLTSGSICIDYGDPDYLLDDSQTDIDGEPRMMGCRVDIGADEFTDEVLRISHRLVYLANQGGPNPPAETVVIEDIDSGVATWQVVEDCPWLDITPRHGQTFDEIIEVTLSIHMSGLEPGSYSRRFEVVPDVDANNSRTVTVDLHVSRGTPLNVPQQYATIQAAIDVAAWGDTVLVAEGTYNENINVKDKNIILTSTEPNAPDVVAGTVIHGDGTASVVTFSGTEESTCNLCGFTITGGYAIEPAHGGGIQGNGTRATISNCQITENSAYRRGGGLFDCDGPIINCTISDNTVRSSATTEGAGLHSCDGPINNCTISNNSSGDYARSGFGGGLYNCHGPITNCTITDNVAGGSGGGLHSCDGPITESTITGNVARNYLIASRGGGLFRCDGTIRNCVINDNIADAPHGGLGGGLAACHADINGCIINGNWSHYAGGGLASCDTVRNCLISGNSTEGNGGGLDRCSSVRNCVISHNLAGQDGGGLNSCSELLNCSVTGNKAQSNGGGIYVQGSSTVANCILQNNTALRGNEIFLDTYWVPGGRRSYEMPSEMLIRYSNVQGGDAEVYMVKNCTVDWAEGNIDADPLFADPGYWDPNGTPEDPNDDIWINGDYHLKSQAGRWDSSSASWVKDDVTSPCIDTGDPNSPVGPEPFPDGGVVNMGAYGGTAEASKSYFGGPVCETIVAGDINGDCMVDFEDFAFVALHWLEDHNQKH